MTFGSTETREEEARSPENRKRSQMGSIERFAVNNELEVVDWVTTLNNFVDKQ